MRKDSLCLEKWQLIKAETIDDNVTNKKRGKWRREKSNTHSIKYYGHLRFFQKRIPWHVLCQQICCQTEHFIWPFL